MVKNTRIEKDALGEVEVNKDALYGVQSVRAQNNFYITNEPSHPEMIKSLGAVKKSAALANKELSPTAWMYQLKRLVKCINHDGKSSSFSSISSNT